MKFKNYSSEKKNNKKIKKNLCILHWHVFVMGLVHMQPLSRPNDQ